MVFPILNLVTCSPFQRCSLSIQVPSLWASASCSPGMCLDFGGSPTCHPSDASSALGPFLGVVRAAAAETTAAVAPGTGAGLTTGRGTVEPFGFFDRKGKPQTPERKRVMSSWERGRESGCVPKKHVMFQTKFENLTCSEGF